MATARALHYVFKIGDRKASYDFFTKVLKMTVLRHEEFETGCKAECNGPYVGKWSKTMIGYGSEDEHFVLELTYNYEVGKYRMGNDFHGIYIEADDVYKILQDRGIKETTPCGKRLIIRDPDGHAFMVSQGGNGKRTITKVAINSVDMKKSVAYWTEQLNMKVVEKGTKKTIMSYGDNQCQLDIRQIDGPIDRASAYGRIAFSYPGKLLETVQERCRTAGYKILKDLVTLETPGKADVQVVILADPNEHEICFVGDEGFRELSKVDPKAEELIIKEIAEDSSSSWYKDGKKTMEA